MNVKRVALVGAGRISRKHLSALAGLKDMFEVVALCDTDQCRLLDSYEYFKELRGDGCDIFLSEDYNVMVNKINSKQIKVDLISICTPSGFHEDQTIAGLRADCSVCVEKPMALSEEGCTRMVEESKKNGRQVYTVMQNRLNPTVQKLKRYLESGKAGKIYMVNANVLWCRPQAYYDQDDWRGTRDFDGGALMNQAIHYFDIIQWLCGREYGLSAFVRTLERKIESEDTGVVNIAWMSGALSSVNVTMLCKHENIEGSITVVTENGSAIIGGKALNRVKYWKFSDDEEVQDNECVDYEPADVYGNGHQEYYKQVYVSLERGAHGDLAVGEQGGNSVRLVEKCYSSSDCNLRTW